MNIRLAFVASVVQVEPDNGILFTLYLPCHGVADSRDLQAANVGKKMLIDNLLLFIP